MNYSIFHHIRDCIFVCSLFFLIKIAYNRNYEFLSAHKSSIIHELNRDFIDQLYTAQRQVHFLQEYPSIENNYAQAIADIKARLTTIEEKYHKNSPALIALGPIGSAAIINKEEILQQKLLAIINEICAILYNTCALSPYEPAQTISEGLQTNKELIKYLMNDTQSYS